PDEFGRGAQKREERDFGGFRDRGDRGNDSRVERDWRSGDRDTLRSDRPPRSDRGDWSRPERNDWRSGDRESGRPEPSDRSEREFGDWRGGERRTFQDRPERPERVDPPSRADQVSEWRR